MKDQSPRTVQKAKSMGLKYLGFGRYGNPEDHRTAYIVKNNELVKVNNIPKDEGGNEYTNETINAKIDAHKRSIENYEKKVNDPHYADDKHYYESALKGHKELLDKALKLKDEHKDYFENISPHIEKQENKSRSWIDAQTRKAELVHNKLNDVYNYDKLTYEERRAAYEYTGMDSSIMIKRALARRGGEGLKDKYEKDKYASDINKPVDKQIMHLDDAIDAIPIPMNLTLYSGLKNPIETVEHFKKGEKLHFAGYISTSIDPNKASKFTNLVKDRTKQHPEGTGLVLQIKAKKGQKGLYVSGNNHPAQDDALKNPDTPLEKYQDAQKKNDIGDGKNHSGSPSEREMILPRDTVFKIISEPKYISNVGKAFEYPILVVQVEIIDQA